MKKLTFDPIAKKALEVMENTSKNVFLTGKAGTGKSTLLRHFLANSQKNLAIVAPT
jgi:tRNA A37 threonylcarbamoyladenosine biosynthesis protein TsaE